jgi:hypothetical protein
MYEVEFEIFVKSGKFHVYSNEIFSRKSQWWREAEAKNETKKDDKMMMLVLMMEKVQGLAFEVVKMNEKFCCVLKFSGKLKCRIQAFGENL